MALLHSPLMLKDIAKRGIAHYLWIKKFPQLPLLDEYEDLDNLYNSVKSDGKQLGLPRICAKALVKEIWVAINLVDDWLCKIEGLKQVPFEYLLQSIKINGQGLIDDLEAVAKIVANEAVDRSIRYQLACQYCLEEEIAVLFSPRNATGCLEIKADRKNFLRSFWSYRQLGCTEEFWRMYKQIRRFQDWHAPNEDSPLEFLNFDDIETPIIQFACLEAALYGPLAAVRHFWSQLTTQEKTVQFKEACNLYLFYNSKPYEKQNIPFMARDLYNLQMTQTLKECPCAILEVFENQPFQWFVIMANLLWEVMDCSKFVFAIEVFTTEEHYLWFWNAAPEELKGELRKDTSVVHEMLGKAVCQKWSRAMQLCVDEFDRNSIFSEIVPILRPNSEYSEATKKSNEWKRVDWTLSNFFGTVADLNELKEKIVQNVEILECRKEYLLNRIENFIDKV